MAESAIETALAQVKAGAVDEYAVVVEACQRRLRGWLATLTPSALDSDELAHRAFVEAYKRIDQYQLGTNFYAWLSAIARHLLLAELKRLQRQEKNSANYLEQSLAAGLAEAAAEPVDEAEERLAALRACQESLAEPSRMLLLERYTHDRSLDTIARQVGKTVAAIKFQLFAIRRKLRDCVAKRLALNRFLAPPWTHQETN